MKERALLFPKIKEHAKDTDFQTELAINQKLKSIKQKGINPLKHVAIAKPVFYKGDIALDLKWMERGTVLVMITNLDSPLSSVEINHIMRGMISGVKELHEHGIKHRDIKNDNFLVDDAGDVKISDMGKSYIGDTPHETIMNPQNMPPDIKSSTEWNEQADIYQLGLSLREVLKGPSGSKPYDEATTTILNRMTSSNPNERPTLLEVAKFFE